MNFSNEKSFSRSTSCSPDFVRIENEIEALSSIYLEDLKKVSFKYPNYEIKLYLKPNPFSNIHGKDPLCWIKLRVKYNMGYPKMPPEIDIYKKYNIIDKEEELICDGIDDICIDMAGQNCEMIHEVCQYLQKFLDEKSREFDPEIFKKFPKSLNSSPRESAMGKIRKYSGALENSKTSNRNSLTNLNNEKLYHLKQLMFDQSYDTSTVKNQSQLLMNDLELNRKINLGSTSISRFQNDFEIINKLGQGGGGVVYKVRNNYDGMYYAIKRIKIYSNKTKQAKKVLREVMLLSRLQHPNIVRYFQAWIEDVKYFDGNNSNFEDEGFEVNEEDEEEEEIEEESEHKSNTQPADNTGSNIYFGGKNRQDESLSNNNEDDYMIVFEESRANNAKNNVWEVEDDKSYHDRMKKEKLDKMKYLFIQMEYCEGNSLKEALEKKQSQDEKSKWKIILQITEALSYIHSKGLIHRDIKPANIFLDKKLEVKLGDFGLATVSKNKTAVENLNAKTREFINFGGDILSCGIGTLNYCSPEQEKQNKYNQKSDMYSFGIVIFEMFHEFGTLMERDVTLKNIKDEHKFPLKFLSTSPHNVIEIVKILTFTEPEKRLSSNELLNSSLIPINVNERIVLDNFTKIIEENKHYTPKFLDILIKNNISSSEKLFISPFDKKNITNSSFDYNYDQLYNKLSYVGHMNIKSFNFVMTIYSKICRKIKKLLSKQNAEYVRFSEIESYSTIYPVFDSISGSFVIFNDKDILSITKRTKTSDNVMLTKTGDVCHSSRHVYNQLSKCVLHNYHINNPPLKIISDFLSIESNNSTNKIQESNEIYYNYIWKAYEANNTRIKIIPEDDMVYEKNCLEILFKSIEKFNLSGNIQISLNSSYILDLIFSKLGVNINDKFKMINFLQTILYSSKVLMNVKDVIKTLIQGGESAMCDYQIPVDKDKLKELLVWLEIQGGVESIKKRIDKKNEIYSEISKICDFFNLFDFNNRFLNLRNKIKIDFSLFPKDIIYYSGLIVQVTHSTNEKIILADAGRIDNYLNTTETSTAVNKGFSLRFYPENFFKIQIQSVKEKEPNNFKLDFLIINTLNEHSDESVKKEVENYTIELSKKAKYEDYTCEFIHKSQKISEFMDYFLAYRMKLLLILTYDEYNKKIFVEYKHMDKKKTVSKDIFSFSEVMTSLKFSKKRNKKPH